jgi:hypothetical protein
MSQDGFKYERMVEDALRGVVREALSQAAKDGLPGEHHFYITFRTDHPDVDIPDSLRERYHNEMTIVLQHQFWNLKIEERRFEVTLSFSNIPHRLVVPYEAVVAFADPSVRFGLQFEAPEGLPDLESSEETAGQDKDGPDGDKPAGDAPGGDTKVVTLDTFRKK